MICEYIINITAHINQACSNLKPMYRDIHIRIGNTLRVMTPINKVDFSICI